MPETASWDEVVAAFAEHGHSRMPVYRETLDEIVGMVLIKDVFAHLASGKPPKDWSCCCASDGTTDTPHHCTIPSNRTAPLPAGPFHSTVMRQAPAIAKSPVAL